MGKAVKKPKGKKTLGVKDMPPKPTGGIKGGVSFNYGKLEWT
jgi:hypothetical protein